MGKIEDYNAMMAPYLERIVIRPCRKGDWKYKLILTDENGLQVSLLMLFNDNGQYLPMKALHDMDGIHKRAAVERFRLFLFLNNEK